MSATTINADFLEAVVILLCGAMLLLGMVALVARKEHQRRSEQRVRVVQK
jgi:hypothetical protein